MAISLIKKEEKHILEVLPILLKRDEQFRRSVYTIFSETFVKKDDFSELKGIVKELAEAQKRTEEGLKALSEEVKALSKAQKKTEEGLKALSEEVKSLSKAQKKTEAGLKALSEEVKALSEDVRALTKSHENLREYVGNLSHTVGFRLEDEAFVALPGLLKRDFGINIKDRLKRRWVEGKDGRYIEINIIGEATKNGKKITIIGEGKSQLSKKDVDDFIKKKIERLNYKEVFPLLITYMIQQPDVEEYAKKKGITLYYSYDFR
ncbi:MAG: chordopoxvirus fusion protein [bacterium]